MIGAIAAHYVDGGGGGGAYSTEVLADSPLGYWRLGEASGSTMADSSGNTRNGAYDATSSAPLLGVAGLISGDSDTAASFDGANDGASVTGAAWMDVTTFTIEAVIKPATIASGTRVIAARQVGTGVFTLRQEAAALKFYHWNSSGTLQAALSSASTLVAGSIYHVAATFEGGVARRLYLGGTEVASQVSAVSIRSATSDLTLGRTSGEYFNGVIDEVAYYGTALSAARIAAHAAAV